MDTTAGTDAGGFILQGATLIDGTGRPPVSDALVVVRKGRIIHAGPARTARQVPVDGLEVLDLRGRSVLPGLVNAHDHLSMKGLLTQPGLERAYYDLYRQPAAYQLLRSARGALLCLAEGQTTVRDAGAMDQLVFATRDAIRAGVLVGPRLYSCGSPISVPYAGAGVKPAGMTVDTEGAEGVRGLTQELIRRGADYIKVKGHRRDFDSPERTRLFSKEELAAAVEAAHASGRRITFHAWHVPIIEAAVELGADAVEHGNPLADSPALAEAMARRGIFLIPNVRSWASERRPDPERARRTGITVERIWDSVEVAIAAGVRLGVGTDLHNASLVDELTALRELGLSPLECIKAATLHGAMILDLEAELGSIEAGKLADLVVVDGDPLVDLNVLRSPSLVVNGGKRYDPAVLRQSIGPSAHFPPS